MPTIPAWCAPPPTFLGRQATVEQALALVDEGPITLVGRAGVGTTVTAGAVLAALCERGTCHRIAAVPIDGAAGRADLALALGQALEAELAGDEASLREALQVPGTVVLLDDADLAPDAVGHMVALSPSVTWILTGREPVVGAAVPVTRLTDAQMAELLPEGVDAKRYAGQPLLAGLPEGIEPDGDWSAALISSQPSLEVLVDLPSGIPAAFSEEVGFGARRIGDRVLAHRAVREALGRDPLPSQPALAASLERHQDALHQLACDLTIYHDASDLRVLRYAAYHLDDISLGALAAAAAARMHLRSFQASQALDLVRHSLSGIRLPHLARGLLRWIEGDALLIQGSHDLAHEAHLTAATELRGDAAGSARLAQARRCADAWVARGDQLLAQTWLGLARAELARRPDPKALADILRLSGNLAAQEGELVGARALYEEALATVASHEDAGRERAFILVGLAALAMVRGDFKEAAEHLEAATRQAEHPTTPRPMAAAAIAWRRAEVALRQGRREEARVALTEASERFRQCGSLRGLFLCARMEGDLHAVEGNRLEAVEAWDHALALCVRTRNLAGLRRVLKRRLVVEREGTPGPHIAELQEHLERAEVLSGVSR